MLNPCSNWWSILTERFCRFPARHPIAFQALCWAVPAMIFAIVLRAMLMSYSPYAYWGSDSNSYFSFAELLLTKGKTSLYEKRRYVYPLVMLPVTMLPGATLRWVAILQHALGVLTLVPLAYCVRRAFVHWRWLVVPVTIFYAGQPIILWYEHEMLAENLFFAAVIWSCAGWMAWVSATGVKRKEQLWWWFFVPFAILVLTKPAGRFFWPGIVLGLVCVAAWRWLKPKEWIALGSVAALTLTIGQDSQGSWLLYTSAFPLTRLDTNLHAEYKAEVHDMVAEARQAFEEFRIDENRTWKRFLKNPEEQDARPLWKALGEDQKKKMRVYQDLAFEGIKAQPFDFLYIAAQRILSSANPDDFKAERFDTDYYPRRFQHLWERYATESPWRLQTLFGLSKREPLPDYATVRRMIEPHPDAPASGWIMAYNERFKSVVKLAHDASDDPTKPRKADELAPVGWWLLIGAVLSFLPVHFRRLGVWTVVIAGYLMGVFLVGGANARFFGAAWGVIALLLAVPVDVLSRIVKKSSSAGSSRLGGECRPC